MAVYRPDPELLRIQINSIKNQSLLDWVCIIGIDGTDFETKKLVLSAIGQDDRFYVKMFMDNLGFYRNFERILSEVPDSVDWIALSDQDDEWMPNKLETIVPYLKRCSLASSQSLIVSKEDIFNSQFTHRKTVNLLGQLIDNQVTGAASVFTPELLRVALPFPPPTKYAYHDFWLGVCAQLLSGVLIVEYALQNYVQHSQNVIGEPTNKSVFQAYFRLNSLAGKSLKKKFQYIRKERWGWRVNMAKTALTRRISIRPDQKRILTRVSAGRPSLYLTFQMLATVITRNAPTGRGLTLLVSSFLGQEK